ncbi:MAG TPA: hypothetical protein QF458_02660 [Candidatus Woesearchaeota archaeon]|nr:hypothetical protein [Candidatus Woesearchaeota archaeon]
MGFLSGIWEFFAKIFSIFSGSSREREEDKERREAKEIAKESGEEKRDDIKENKIIKEIVKELKRIDKELRREKSPVELRMGQRVVTIEEAVEVLIHHLEKLIGTEESPAEEKRDLEPIEHSWLVLRQILVNKELHKDVEKVNSLLGRLKVTVDEEVKVSWQKIQKVKKLWNDIQESEMGTKKQQAPK